MLTSVVALQAAYGYLELTALGREVLALGRRMGARPWILPVRGPYAGVWWFGLMIFPHDFRGYDEQPAITGAWLAHETVHVVQNRVRGTRTPLQGSLYREVEAEVVRYALMAETARLQGDLRLQAGAQSVLRSVAGDLDAAFYFIQNQPLGAVYRSPLYRLREPQAELMGWRRSLVRLGFTRNVVDQVEGLLADDS